MRERHGHRARRGLSLRPRRGERDVFIVGSERVLGEEPAMSRAREASPGPGHLPVGRPDEPARAERGRDDAGPGWPKAHRRLITAGSRHLFPFGALAALVFGAILVVGRDTENTAVDRTGPVSARVTQVPPTGEARDRGRGSMAGRADRERDRARAAHRSASGPTGAVPAAAVTEPEAVPSPAPAPLSSPAAGPIGAPPSASVPSSRPEAASAAEVRLEFGP